MSCGYEIKSSYDPCSYERNFCNCVKKPEKFRTSTGFATQSQDTFSVNWILKLTFAKLTVVQTSLSLTKRIVTKSSPPPTVGHQPYLRLLKR